MRLLSFSQHGIPQAFSLVLFFFLFGIALGAELGRRVCIRQKNLIFAAAWMLLLAAIVDGLIVVYWRRWATATVAEYALLIIGSSLCKSMLFPIVHHVGSAEHRQGLGRSVSLVYFSNIIGSTAGPMFTGFLFLDHVSLFQAFVLISAADLVLAAACFAKTGHRRSMILTAAAVPLLFVCFEANIPLVSAKHILENRHGIIHVGEGGIQGDIIFGGNVYDGRINTSLTINSNGINRVYMLAALHPAPKQVLVIGVSAGSWTRVLSGFPGVERIDAIEINPGYFELIKNYPEVADILTDPKVHFFVDDGRRWLKRNPHRKYDLIVMNTTYHYRSYASLLLSAQFLQIVRHHMNSDAILSFNTTGSMDALKTASTVFNYAFLYGNFAVAADIDFRRNLAHGFDRIAMMKWNNTPVFNLSDRYDREAIYRTLTAPFTSIADATHPPDRPYEVITDQNMITEFKYGAWGYRE